MYRVETHNNSKKYFENLNIENDSIYISANTSITNMMKELPNVSEKDRWRFVDIDNFLNYMYPKWNDTINRIKLKAQLRLNLLSVKNEFNNIEDLKEIQFFEDNLEILFSDFIFFFECGVRELKINSEEIKFKILKELYKRFIENNYFLEISKELLNSESLFNVKTILVNNYIEGIKKTYEEKSINILNIIKNNEINIKKIYIYNLNTIDVKRYLMIEKLKSIGYEIVFRIPYFQNLNVVNKCWDMIYKNDEIFYIDKSKIYSNSIKENVKYLEFLEGNRIQQNNNENIIVKNYREVSDFLNDVNDNVIVTFYKDSLKSCMKRNKLKLRNHAYKTSIGRFIYYIYKCEVKNNDVRLDFNLFRELITSGWIEYKEWNGNRLSAFLVDNEEYFSGVQTIDEIIDRILKIKDAEEVQNIFEEQSKNRIKKNETKAFLSNPFRAFGYLNMGKYNITANYMYEIAAKLKRFLLKEFDEVNDVLDVEQHLNNMQLLFRNSAYIRELYKIGTDEEKNMLKKIYYILSTPSLFGERLHKNEIAELFYSYLFLKEHDKEDQENDFSIDQLEGVILRDKLFLHKLKRKICLADLSYIAYEKHLEKYRISGKVFSDEEVEEVFKQSLIGRNKEIVLQGLCFKEKSKLAIESYIKFSLANLFINFDGKVELSWIESLRKDDSKSIILKQIENLYKSNINIKQKLDKDDLIIEKEFEEIYSYDEKVINENHKNLPEVAFRDLDFCGEKFLYSSIIQDYPIYYSDFHNRLVFSAIVSILKNSIEDGYVNICRYIFPLFPQWEDVVKKNILDCEYARSNIKMYKYFDGINYPKNIDSLYLLKSKYAANENRKIRNKYNKEEFSGDIYYKEFINDFLKEDDLNSGRHCMMCSHCYVCRKGEFVIDYK